MERKGKYNYVFSKLKCVELVLNSY